jgi:hypothetical protein
LLLQEVGGPGEERGLSLADSIAIAYSMANGTGLAVLRAGQTLMTTAFKWFSLL